MKGIPFFGKNTQEILDSLNSQEVTSISVAEFLGEKPALYALFERLIGEEWLFVIEKEGVQYFSWCWDTRFDYRDRFIFVPYLSYEVVIKKATELEINNPMCNILTYSEDETFIFLRHELEQNYLVLDNRNAGYRINSITVYHPETARLLNLDISDLPYLTGNTFDMDFLLKSHTDYTLDLLQFDKNNINRHYVDTNARLSREVKSLKNNGYKLYKERIRKFNYSDVRKFQVTPFSEEHELISTDRYVIRRFHFEGYLYCLFGANLIPNKEEYISDWLSLGLSKRFIVLENHNDLILKYYYKNGNFRFRKRTYERYMDKVPFEDGV